MRLLSPALLFLVVGCVLAPVDFRGKRCENDAVCGDGLICALGTCATTGLDAGVPQQDAGLDDGGPADAGPGCTDDAFEPNERDAPAAAPASQVLILCPGDQDWFFVDLTEASRLYASLTFVHADGDLSLLVLDGAGLEVTSGRSGDDNESIVFDVAVTGTYRIGVVGVAGAGNRYRLQVDTPLEIDAFTAPPTVSGGDSATLRWDVRNATSCAITPGVGVVSSIGEVEVVPTLAGQTFTLRCDDGESFAEANVTTLASCAVRCDVDVALGLHDCAAPVTPTSVIAGQSVFTLDLIGSDGLYLEMRVCNPSGFVIDLADSPTCDGGGGDAASSSNDAEVQIGDGVSPSTLIVHDNDFGPGTPLLSVVDHVAAAGCTDLRWLAQDSRFVAIAPAASVESEFGMRLTPPVDLEGTPDALWYLGLNRVVGLASPNTGAGAISASICVR